MYKTVHLDPKARKRPLDEVLKLVEALLDRGKRVAVTVAEEEEMLSPQQSAARLRFSRQHVMRLIRAGELEAGQMPGSDYWKIPLSSILALEERRAAARTRADELSRELDRLGAPLE